MIFIIKCISFCLEDLDQHISVPDPLNHLPVQSNKFPLPVYTVLVELPLKYLTISQKKFSSTSFVV